MLKHMLAPAVERDYLAVYPLVRYRLVPEVQPPLRILGYDEYRTLVEQVTAGDPVTGAYTVFLGETGTRKQANPAGARPQKKGLSRRRSRVRVSSAPPDTTPIGSLVRVSIDPNVLEAHQRCQQY